MEVEDEADSEGFWRRVLCWRTDCFVKCACLSSEVENAELAMKRHAKPAIRSAASRYNKVMSVMDVLLILVPDRSLENAPE